MNAVVDGVRVVREGWAPRAWLARFRLLPVAPSRYVDERSLYAVRDMIREHLVSPFPFHIKLSLRIQRVNRQSGELEEDDFMQHLVPWISQPSADPELRMHRVVSAARWKLETAAERSALPGSDWVVGGISWIDVLVAPGLENVPAPGVGGGHGVELPSSLTNQ